MKYNLEAQYCDLLNKILEEGKVSKGRNAVTSSIFGEQIKYEVFDQFPVLLMRKLYPKGVIGEFAAFLHRPTCVQDFEAYDCNYWKSWADEDGALRVDYGNKWIDFDGMDQLAEVIFQLRADPHSRRHLISGWHPVSAALSSLPCCHYAYQFYVDSDATLNLVWIQRSADVMIGLPSDIILANLMLIMVSHLVQRVPGTITMQLGDCHIYSDHAFGALEYLRRATTEMERRHSPWQYYPSYDILEISTYQQFTPEKFKLQDWSQLPPIELILHK